MPTSHHTLNSPLLLDRIEIRRMPGFNRIGFTLDQLSPGINIIFGPNAVGKSTTARAILTLLWPEVGSGRESLLGRMSIGGDEWSVHVDIGYREWQRSGVVSTAPPLPSAQGRDRYILSLPDLLVAHDRDFAAMIARESVGGYDLQRLAKDMGFDQSLPGKKNIPIALKEAQKRLDTALAEQENLLRDERNLTELKRRYDEAAAADAQVEIYDRLIEVLDARERERAAKDALSVFPTWIGYLRGDEDALLKQLKDEAERAEKAIALAREAIKEARESQESTGLPPDGISSFLMKRLKFVLEKMTGWEQQLIRTEDDLQVALKQRQSASLRLGDDVDVEALPEIDGASISAFAKLAEGWHDLDARQKDLVVQQKRLIAQAKETADPDTLRRGIHLLVQWLLAAGQSKAAGQKTAVWLGLIGWVVAAASSLMLSLSVDATYTWLLVASLITLFIMWSRTKQREKPEDRGVYEREYQQLEIEGDVTWTEDAVGKKIEALQRALLDALAESQRMQQLSLVEAELSRLRDEEIKLEDERQQLVSRFGLPQKEDVAKLWWLVQRISEWQQADDQVRRLQQVKEEMQTRIDDELAAIQDELSGLGFQVDRQRSGTRAVSDLKAIVSDLEDRMAIWQAARQKIDQAENEVTRAEEALQDAMSRREELFNRLGLTGDESEREAAVIEGCRILSQYRAAHDALTGATSVRETAERLLRERVASFRSEQAVQSRAQKSDELDVPDDPLQDVSQEDIVVFGRGLLEWTKEEAQRGKDQALLQARQSEEILREIERINVQIDKAKRDRSVEAALADYESAQDDLRSLFEQECRLELSRLILDHVHQATKERDRPQVFHRARERFARMTHGAYRLELDDGEIPSFRAIDTATGEGKSLDQLSSGTRAQLLIAVRVAFVESIETGLRLPIIFDEALANSDDVRADAIIQAVLDLAASGRQVFYFTAQADEVGKWRAALTERPEIAHRLIDLRDVKEMDLVKKRPLPKQPRIGEPKVPEPRDLEYEAYGRLLNVPGIDPYDEEIGHVHLWHLLDDAHALQRFLSSSIETWGALKTLHDLGGLQGLGDWAVKAYERAAVAAKCLQAVLSASRVGRGRPVDRQVLLDCNVISDAFLESAAELAAACEYDAKRFMAAIDGGELKRFRADNKEQLRAYFEEHGYLDYRDPLPEELLNAHVIAQISSDLSQGLISGDHVERLIRTVAHELNKKD